MAERALADCLNVYSRDLVVIKSLKAPPPAVEATFLALNVICGGSLAAKKWKDITGTLSHPEYSDYSFHGLMRKLDWTTVSEKRKRIAGRYIEPYSEDDVIGACVSAINYFRFVSEVCDCYVCVSCV